MYELGKAEYIRENPWDTSFESRLSRLLNAHKNGFKTIVYLYEKSDTSTFRYRVYNMCQVLDESDSWTGIYFFENEIELIKKYITTISALILVRFRWSFELNDFVRQIKLAGIPVGFDVDDMIYDTKYIPIVTNTLAVQFNNESDYKYWFEYTGRIGATAHMCDFSVTTNEYIAKKIREDFSITVYVIPNFYNREQDEASYFIRNKKQEILTSKDRFMIGYFSGTPSHINDFLTVAPELRDLLYKNDDIFLRIVGFMNLPNYMQELKNVNKIEMVPLQNFIDLQTKIGEVDVNIVPLVNNDFTNCKSELKFFEAAIVDTVTCATPTYVYTENIKHNDTGYLCNPGEWYNTITSLYTNGIPNAVVQNGRDYVISNYAYYNQRQKLEDVLESIISK